MASTTNQICSFGMIYKEKATRPKPQSLNTCSSSFKRSNSIFHSSSIYLLLFFIMMQLPKTTPLQLQQMMCKYLRYKEKCNVTLEETRKNFADNETVCWGEFDGFMCWPHGVPGVVHEKCPDYLDGVNETAKGHRFCLSNGSWHRTPTDSGPAIWDHRLECSPSAEDDYTDLDDTNSEMAMLNALAIVYTVGYAISLVCLVVALIIFTYFRKLHCTRNYIHINLMLSFIVRYIAVLAKDRVLQSHYDPNRFDQLDDKEMELFCDQYGGISGFMISCRLVITLMHYGILANYFWLLAEGVYLQTLLLFAMSEFKDNKYFPLYMAGGWGAPWIFVGVWVVLRLTFENDGCWEIYESNEIWWILRVPVILSIGINFVVFINVIRLIVSKLRAHHINRNDYKLTLAKSTLALIPLLGIHYIVFLAITDDVVQSNDLIMKIKLHFEMVLTSIQGMLIAVFYCFLNGEVQGEVKKFWKNIRLKNGLPSHSFRKGSSYHTNGTQFTGLVSSNSADDRSHAMQETSLLSPNGGACRSTSINSDTLQPPKQIYGQRAVLSDPQIKEEAV